MQLESKDGFACTHSASDHVKTSPNEFFCIYQNRFILMLLTANLKRYEKVVNERQLNLCIFPSQSVACQGQLVFCWRESVQSETRVFRTSVQLRPRQPMNWHELCPPRIYSMRQNNPASWIWLIKEDLRKDRRLKFPKNSWLYRQ